MTAAAETMRVAASPRRYGIRYGTSLTPSSTARAQPRVASRETIDTAAGLVTDLAWSSLYFDWQARVFAHYVACEWASPRLMEAAGTCLHLETAEGSGTTKPVAASGVRALDVELEHILSLAQHEEFEAGMCSQFEERLRIFVGDYGEPAITALHGAMRRGLKTDVIVEALTTLGRMRHGLTRDARLGTLAAFLQHRDSAIRDAAMRGLLDMHDARARPPLRRALAVEPNNLLKKSLQEVLALLPK